MKRFCTFLLSAFIATLTHADVLRVESIDHGVGSQQTDLLFLSDGRVAYVAPGTLGGLNIPEDSVGGEQYFSVEIDEHHNLKSIEPVKVLDRIDEDSSSADYMIKEFEPTILPNLAAVDSVFEKMNRRWQEDSQCYNRAHVWNYEEFQRSNLISKKVFIFYTRKYIRNYRFKWWFHAIPTVLANHEGTIVERALDPMFANSALPMKAWTDIFIQSRRTCPVITKYSSYRDNQETEDCYLHFSTMYFWQPRDLDRLERTGAEKKDFIRSEVNHAYWEAF